MKSNIIYLHILKYLGQFYEMMTDNTQVIHMWTNKS